MSVSFAVMNKHTAPETDRRLARRFPLELPVKVDVPAQRHETVTKDISAGGVTLYVDTDMELGATLEFTLVMPAEKLKAPGDVLVKCVGRVVRCSDEGSRREVAMVIDDYSFERS